MIPTEVHDLLTALYHRESSEFGIKLTRPELDLLSLTLHTLAAETPKPVVPVVVPQGPSKPPVLDVSAPLVDANSITAAEIAIRKIQLMLAKRLPPSPEREEVSFALEELLMMVQYEQTRRRRVGA